ncbi:MAG: Fe-S cluster assembly protein SufB [Bacilli bacterium]|nr:Fe-S cluster assembly protein SufB [Bacilli bacterium]MDD4547579.1 Fe-S cluster assembly protein SufB [Bacilli bacterium]
MNNDYKYGFNDGEVGILKLEKGLTEEIVRKISLLKQEPEWLLEYRLKAYHQFLEIPNPKWGLDLSHIDLDDIYYYLKPSKGVESTWDKVPETIKNTFDKIGIIEAEDKYLSGIATQYESEVVYHNLEKELQEKGVIFLDTDSAIKRYPELFKEYFGTLVPSSDNKYAALNSAVFSGGSFIYVPKGVKLSKPLQSYFRINSEKMGQFERTLIIVDEGADLTYVEGCTAPTYSNDALHAAVVEIFVKKGGRCRYTAIQNWSNNVYNLVTKRAICEENATMEWIDGNIGSKANMKYPAVILKGEGSSGTTISIAVSGAGQIQDAGAKMIHLAPNTSSNIISKSISKDGGNSIYRGLVYHGPLATNAKTHVECDTLILDEHSKSDTIPLNTIKNGTSTLEHEAKVSKISEELLYYIMSRGISEADANEMIVMGFVEPFTKELPMEYAIELNQLLKLEMEGSVG